MQIKRIISAEKSFTIKSYNKSEKIEIKWLIKNLTTLKELILDLKANKENFIKNFSLL